MKKNSVFAGGVVILTLAVVFLGFEVSKLKKQVAGFSSSNWVPPVAQHMYSFSNMFPQREWNFSSELRHLEREMDRMFNDSSSFRQRRHYFNSGSGFFNPDVDMQENAGQYVIKVDIPGMEKSKIDIEVKGNSLVISGEKDKEVESSKDGRFFRKERSFGSFVRMITLPPDAETDKINARYNKGVLTITIPKTTSNKAVSGKKVAVQ